MATFVETGKVKGSVTLTLRDVKTGEIIGSRVSNNFVSEPGIYHVLDMLRNRSNVIGMAVGSAYCAVGTGSSAEDVWQTTLDAEVSGTGNPGRKAVTSVTRNNQTVLISTFFDANEASGTLTECGLFVTGYDSGGNLLTASDSKDSGVMFSKATFTQITKDTSSSLTIDWSIAF